MARIIWNRVGSNYTGEPTDVSEAVDMAKLARIVTDHVGGYVLGDFGVRLEISVKLDGGKDLTLPFGNGRIE